MASNVTRDLSLTAFKQIIFPLQIYVYLFQFVDRQRFFIASDLDLLLDIFKTELNFLQCTWKHMLGRPIVTLELNKSFLGNLTHCCLLMLDVVSALCPCWQYLHSTDDLMCSGYF